MRCYNIRYSPFESACSDTSNGANAGAEAPHEISNGVHESAVNYSLIIVKKL